MGAPPGWRRAQLIAVDQRHTHRARWITNERFWPLAPVAVTVTANRWKTWFEPSIFSPVVVSFMF